MKRIIVLVLALMVLAACNNSDSKDKKEDKPVAQATDNSGNPDYTKGLGLVAKSDCLTCHKIDEPLTGPPYREVANKYAGLPDTIVTHLANKIISGGKGVWGEVYMTPHPGISMVDAQAMVKYILLLKK